MKISRKPGILRKLEPTFPQKSLCLLYIRLIKPQLQYCAPIRLSIVISHLKKFASVHNRALKIIGSMDKFLKMLPHISSKLLFVKVAGLSERRGNLLNVELF